MTEADLQPPTDRGYRIGLFIAKSEGVSAEKLQEAAEDTSRWLEFSPAPPTETVEGAVLNYAAARKAAFWSYFNPMAWTFYVVGAAVIALGAIEYGWWEATVLSVMVGGVLAFQLGALGKWWLGTPSLLSSLPSAGTRIAVTNSNLIIGDTAIPYDEIRFAEILLRQNRSFGNVAWWEFYRFLDRVTVKAGGKLIHLDATAIHNGQSIIDTLCSRVPVTAFS
jgi:hypothetical protein